jgi:hypothetical protein
MTARFCGSPKASPGSVRGKSRFPPPMNALVRFSNSLASLGDLLNPNRNFIPL